MDGFSVSYTDDALQDLRDIYSYISGELRSSRVAAAQVKRIREEVRALGLFPKRYKAVAWEPWKSREMRQMPVDNFIVFYVVDDEAQAVHIVRIFYGKRDIPNIVGNDR